MKTHTKPFSISKKQVWEAWKQVKRNRGAAGIDTQSLEDYSNDLENNLYKLWNRLSSGSYHPAPVKAVEIPKANGKGTRRLGVPTVADRIAQTVAKNFMEPTLERIFVEDSYGYRPGKSALQAVSVVRTRNWKYDWVFEFDIKGAFDSIPHCMLLKAVRHHFSEKWILCYIERWLKAPFSMGDSQLAKRTSGTPQGGVLTPQTQLTLFPYQLR